MSFNKFGVGSKPKHAIVYNVLNDEQGALKFMVQSVRESLVLAIVGDYGEYSYWWNSVGLNWRKFLMNSSYDSFFNKMADNNGYVIDLSKSTDKLKESLGKELSRYRCDGRYKEEISTIIDEYREILNVVDDVGVIDVPTVMYYNGNDEYFGELINHKEYLVFMRDSECKNIWKLMNDKLFPHFKAELGENVSDVELIMRYDHPKLENFQQVGKYLVAENLQGAFAYELLTEQRAHSDRHFISVDHFKELIMEE